MNAITLVVMLYTSQLADQPRDIVRVPLPGATIEQCEALRSGVEVLSIATGQARSMRCEVSKPEGLRV